MILVIGGDHLGSIDKNLRNCGFTTIQHINGRNHNRLQIASGTELILVLVDYVNHNLAKWVKAEAKAHNVPIIFARRSWSTIYESLQSCFGSPQAKPRHQNGARASLHYAPV